MLILVYTTSWKTQNLFKGPKAHKTLSDFHLSYSKGRYSTHILTINRRWHHTLLPAKEIKRRDFFLFVRKSDKSTKSCLSAGSSYRGIIVENWSKTDHKGHVWGGQTSKAKHISNHVHESLVMAVTHCSYNQIIWITQWLRRSLITTVVWSALH